MKHPLYDLIYPSTGRYVYNKILFDITGNELSALLLYKLLTLARKSKGVFYRYVQAPKKNTKFESWCEELGIDRKKIARALNNISNNENIQIVIQDEELKQLPYKKQCVYFKALVSNNISYNVSFSRVSKFTLNLASLNDLFKQWCRVNEVEEFGDLFSNVDSKYTLTLKKGMWAGDYEILKSQVCRYITNRRKMSAKESTLKEMFDFVIDENLEHYHLGYHKYPGDDNLYDHMHNFFMTRYADKDNSMFKNDMLGYDHTWFCILKYTKQRIFRPSYNGDVKSKQSAEKYLKQCKVLCVRLESFGFSLADYCRAYNKWFIKEKSRNITLGNSVNLVLHSTTIQKVTLEMQGG